MQIHNPINANYLMFRVYSIQYPTTPIFSSRFGLKQKLRKLLRKTIYCFLIVSIGATLLFRYLPPPFSSLMVTQFMVRRALATAPSDWTIRQRWVPLEKIPCHFIKAVMAAEDQKFESHSGFDIPAMKAALKNNLSGKRLRGGSTISQQTVKNLYLWPGRSILRKGFEAYFTLLMELLWSKHRIMETYLNIIEMGDGIFGVEAAAKIYFHKSALHLTQSESALLAAILPAPRSRKPTVPSPYLKKRQHWILNQMTRMKSPQLCQ